MVLSILGVANCLTGLAGIILAIPGHLVSRDPWDSMPVGTYWDCPGYPMHEHPDYPGILTIAEC